MWYIYILYYSKVFDVVTRARVSVCLSTRVLHIIELYIAPPMYTWNHTPDIFRI